MRRSFTNCFKAAGVMAIVLGSFAFTSKSENVAVVEPSQASGALKGKALMEKSDCMACHTLDTKIVGPAFKEIAQKYKGDKNALAMLTDKVIQGGAGNWGEIPMSPHPQLSKADASEMVKYILSLAPTAAPAKPAAKPGAKPAAKKS